MTDSGISRRAFVSRLSAGGLVLAGDVPALPTDQARPGRIVIGCAPQASPRRGDRAVSGTIAATRAAGIGTLVVPVFGTEERVEAMGLLLRWRRMMADLRGEVVVVERTGDLDLARRDGRVALVGAAHGLQWLGRDVRLLGDGRAGGILAVKLSAGWRNLAADGAFEPTDLGLTRFGLELVRAVAEARMVLDVAGAGRKSALQAIERAGALVMASHAGAAAVHPHPGNLDDDRIRAVARAGGVIGLTAFPAQLGPGEVGFDQWRRHLDHLLRVAGPDHVGLGLDFDDVRPRRFPTDPWPDPPFRYPSGVANPADVGSLEGRLRGAGLPAAAVAGVLGGNFDRLFRAALGAGSTQSRRS